MSSLCSEVGNDEMWRLDRDMSVISGSFLSFDSLGETKQLHILIACLKTTRYYTKYNNKQATYYYTYPLIINHAGIHLFSFDDTWNVRAWS